MILNFSFGGMNFRLQNNVTGYMWVLKTDYPNGNLGVCFYQNEYCTCNLFEIWEDDSLLLSVLIEKKSPY